MTLAPSPVRLDRLEVDLQQLGNHPDLPPHEAARYYGTKLEWEQLQRRIDERN